MASYSEQNETSAFTDKTKTSNATNPKASASFLSILLFWWMNKTLNSGNKKALQSEDLHPLQEVDQTDILVGKLTTEWTEYVKSARANGKQPHLWQAMLRVIPVKAYVTLVVLHLLAGTANVGLVVLIWFYLRSLSDSSGKDILTSSLYIGGIGAVSLVRAVCVHHSYHHSEVWGIRLRAAMIGIIYKKILAISRRDLEKANSMNTVNLVSNDAGKLEKSVSAFGILFSAFIELVASICISWFLISWKALIGAVAFILVVVYIVLIAGKMSDLRRKAAEYIDRRLKTMSEVISAIRAVKMGALECFFRDKIYGLRRKEMSYIRRKGIILSSFVSLKYTTTSIAAFISLTVILTMGNHLQAFQIFTLLLGFNLMKNAICISIADSLRFFVDVHIALKRVQIFLEQDTSFLRADVSECAAIRRTRLAKEITPHGIHSRLTMVNVSSRWNEDGSLNAVDNVSLDVTDNQLVVITGAVGSGKSSLLLSVLEELPLSNGKQRVVGRIAYTSQTPWVFSGTIRDNIIFGRLFNKPLYDQVIKACDLQPDLAMFPRGHLSIVGQNGATLSGGQRARLSLARALYSEADIYLLDDPLSAIDSKVSKRLFERCICGLLANRIRVLVTHQVQYMNAADYVVVMEEGSVTYQGSPKKIYGNTMYKTPISKKSKNRSSVEEAKRVSRVECLSKKSDLGNIFEPRQVITPEGLDENKEDRSTGSVSLQLYWTYLKAGIHPVGLGILLLFLCFAQVCVISPSLWLSRMSNMSREQQQDSETLQIYATLVSTALITSTLSAVSFYYVTVKAAKVLHEWMTEAVIKSPAIFFDTNPAGRILNRFSRDIGLIDEQLPTRFLKAIQVCLLTFTALIVPAASNYWLILAVLPFFVVTVYYGHFYLRSARELKRLEALKCSPVYSHFTDTVAGLETIRSSNAEGQFIRQFFRYQDENTQASYLVVSSARWMGIRLELSCAVFVTAVAIGSLVIGNNAALAGLSLTFAMETLSNVQYVVRSVSQVENMMTSVERVLAYTKLDPEPGYSVQEAPDDSWPQEGSLQFSNVSLQYNEAANPVLKDVSFSVAAREKVGVVGRTGAGKSSIAAALFRIPDPKGKVLIDGVDIGTLNLQVARTSMVVITQEPALFSGSLRENLDPMVRCTDARIWSTLEQVGVKKLVQELPGQLQYYVTESGANFSVGQQQLLCLARALTKNTRILIMDEPTANVDFQTNQMIQKVVQQHFKHCTLLTIAHRLDMVMNCDKVLVLDGGWVVEFGNPQRLLEKQKGLFYEMVQTYKEADECTKGAALYHDTFAPC